MTGSPFPELRLLASLETAEAVAGNMEEAVRHEIGSIVGFSDPTPLPVSLADDCMFDIGTGPIWNTMEELMRAICIAFKALSDKFTGIAEVVAESVRQVVDSILQGIGAAVSQLVSSLSITLSNAVNAIAAKLREVVTAIISTLDSLVSGLVAKMRDMVNAIQDVVGAIFSKIGEVVDAILDKIKEGFSALLDAAALVINRVGDGVSFILNKLMAVLLDTLQRIGTGITQIVEPLVGAAEGGLARVRQVIEDIPTTLREMATDVQAFVGESIGGPLANVGDIIVTQVETFFGRLIDDLQVSPETILRDFLQGIGISDEMVDRFASATDKAMPRTPFMFLLGAIALVPLVAGPLLGAIISPITEELRQEVAQRVTPTLIPPGETLDAFIRGEMNEDRMRKELGEAGFSNERIDILVSTSRRLLDLGELFRWWLRGFIEEEELDHLLRMQRISPADIETLKLSAFPLPPVGDLIRMAVREVFSPEIRQRFGQDEGFPTEFAEYGAQQGISEFWAKAYWAAHWALPSPAQGFEMLHRKVIGADDLGTLLRALDVMPFWRDKLTAIAYHPLTRVDLRRMHKLGLLDEQQLQRRYEDLGFNAADAGMMVAFTLAYNEDEPPLEVGELEGLTRSTALGMYEDGIITREQAVEVLLALGFGEDGTELFLVQREMEIERANRQAEIGLVVDQARAGAITFEDAQDRLGEMGLEPAELAKAVSRLLREQERQTSIPPRGDLDKMLGANLIDEAAYIDALQRRGFTRFWAQNYLALMRAG